MSITTGMIASQPETGDAVEGFLVGDGITGGRHVPQFEAAVRRPDSIKSSPRR